MMEARYTERQRGQSEICDTCSFSDPLIIKTKKMRKSKIVLGVALLLMLMNSCDSQDKSKWKEKIHVTRSGTEHEVSTENQREKVNKSDEYLKQQHEEDAKNQRVDDSEKNEAYLVVEEMPEFPGGTSGMMEYLSGAIRYPEEAVRDGIQGRVMVSFVIDKDGKVTNAEVIRGIDDLLDKEALRVVNLMPKWRPGRHEGENVPVKYTFPVNFKLP